MGKLNIERAKEALNYLESYKRSGSEKDKDRAFDQLKSLSQKDVSLSRSHIIELMHKFVPIVVDELKKEVPDIATVLRPLVDPHIKKEQLFTKIMQIEMQFKKMVMGSGRRTGLFSEHDVSNQRLKGDFDKFLSFCRWGLSSLPDS